MNAAEMCGRAEKGFTEELPMTEILENLVWK
jgi:hypothetical protein